MHRPSGSRALTASGLLAACAVAAGLLRIGSVEARPARPSIREAWVVTAAGMPRAGLVSFTVESPVADRLLGARVPVGVAATAELHRAVEPPPVTAATAATAGDAGSPATVAADAASRPPSTGPSTGPSTAPTTGPAVTRPSAMSMRPAEWIDLPAGTAVTLAAGGPHVMLMGVHRPLKVGATIALTLRFARAGSVTVPVSVRSSAS